MTSSDKSIKVDDTPVPSSKSGKRFEDLYRLKGVVSVGCYSTLQGFESNSHCIM